MATEKVPTFAEELRRLFPGKKVPLDPAQPDGVGVTVYPVGVRHLDRFSEVLNDALHEILRAVPDDVVKALFEKDAPPVPGLERPGLGAPPDAKTRMAWDVVKELVPGLTRVVTKEMFHLVGECCRPNPFTILVPDGPELPHWYGGALLDAWLEQSFDSEQKVRPWVRAMENLVERLTGERVDLWGPLSRFFSPEVIASVRSSMRDSLDSRTTGGPSPSGDTGPSAQAALPDSAGPSSSRTPTSRSARSSRRATRAGSGTASPS
jgi:hypothetical protein